MADIDKALPNTRKEFSVPGEEELVSQAEEQVEIEEAEGEPEGGDEHYSNLAEFLPDDILGDIASDLNGKYMDYSSSRKDWEKAYITGLDLLGFKYDNRTEPFQGASGATHPVLAEAVTQFQALAYKELLPADGPVRTQVYLLQKKLNKLKE